MPNLAALLLLATVPLRAPAPPARETPARIATLERILVVGASLSHGWGLEAQGTGRVCFSDVIEASLRVEHEPVRPRTSLFFFADPLPTGQAIVAAGKAAAPTLVVGLDYLFWFGYGIFPDEEQRMKMLEKGLDLLGQFTCPVLVGDFPDVRVASWDRSQGGEGWLLAPEQVPAASTLRKLNERLREWARARGNVVIVPLGDLVGRMHAGKLVEIHGNTWAGKELEGLVQPDHLHPTLEGAIALWLGALEALVAARPEVPGSAFDWDARGIRKRIQETKAKERGASPRAR